jgi:molybdopterin molybdotransferase
MLGRTDISVHRKPVVACLSTGDELIPPGSDWSPGKIYESNTAMLAALVQKYGGELVRLGISPDQPGAIRSALDRAVEQRVDLILSTAGVSVGEFDYVRSVVEEHGSLEFWRVNMRPGKPLAFGSYRGVPFIGLPGNPVSAFTGFIVFVRPTILKMLGMSAWQRITHRVKTLEYIESDGRESYVRAIVQHEAGEWTARIIPNQGSGNLRSLVQANALLLVPSGVKSVPIGSLLDAWLLGEN